MRYLYFCNQCEKEKEIEHGINESPIIKCQCGNKMQRKICCTNIIFKGTGWSRKDDGKADDSMMKDLHPEAHAAHKAGKI